jgi:hypothetical protein
MARDMTLEIESTERFSRYDQFDPLSAEICVFHAECAGGSATWSVSKVSEEKVCFQCDACGHRSASYPAVSVRASFRSVLITGESASVTLPYERSEGSYLQIIPIVGEGNHSGLRTVPVGRGLRDRRASARRPATEDDLERVQFSRRRDERTTSQTPLRPNLLGEEHARKKRLLEELLEMARESKPKS